MKLMRLEQGNLAANIAPNPLIAINMDPRQGSNRENANARTDTITRIRRLNYENQETNNPKHDAS